MRAFSFRPAVFVTLAILLAASAARAEQSLQIVFVQGRANFQTNEIVEVAVVRSDVQALAAGELRVLLRGPGGSSGEFFFALPAAAVRDGKAQATAHLRYSGWLLKPGAYTLEAAVEGAAAQASFELFNHIRRSTFKLINWGRAKDDQRCLEGEDGLGFNVIYGHYSKNDGGAYIRAGCDFFSCCTMGGGHQMDLRMECDWSDPNVLQAGSRRVSRRAFIDRTSGNVHGVHFYDEPGLTWFKDPVTGQTTPHGVPAQRASYEAAFGIPAPTYHEIDPKNPEHAARWKHWATWKLGFMDAAWKDAQAAVDRIKPGWLSITQSQYGFSAFTDGYYFNVARSLPIVSGHGGYHDWGPGYWHPSLTLEFARARDWDKPCWYLPTWYGNTTSDQMRLEQYLSFMTNIEGMITPPDCDPVDPKKPSASGIVESNKAMARLGPVLEEIPVHRPPVALLYSLSHLLQRQVGDMSFNYAHSDAHYLGMTWAYLAGKLMQHQFLPVLDEDIADGTLAAHHKAVILCGVDYLAPEVVAGLEAFMRSGGAVLQTADCELKLPGAVDLGVTPALPEPEKAAALKERIKPHQDRVGALEQEKKKLAAEIKPLNDRKKASKDETETAGLDEKIKALQAQQASLSAQQKEIRDRDIAPLDLQFKSLTAMRGDLHAAAQLVPALKAQFEKLGIRPVLLSTEPGIAATRQPDGDLEYVFAVNAKHDPQGHPQLGLMAAETRLTLATGGRAVYDALIGGPVPEFSGADGAATAGDFRFGPGQMRVFALTARPIGSVKAGRPVLDADFTRREAPIRLRVSAALLDTQGGLLAGAAPLRVRVLDPFGAVRYDLFRATRQGTLNLELPLAANDPAGAWSVEIEDLLARTRDRAGFAFAPPAVCGGLAGSEARALIFEDDRAHILRFFRTHRNAAIVPGPQPWQQAAAERLKRIAANWHVDAQIVPLAEAVKPRALDEAQARSWAGLHGGRFKPGAEQNPRDTGYAESRPMLLLGTPEDHPIVKLLNDEGFLPYAPAPGVIPGANRGLVAWQYDGVGARQESIVLLAYDEQGMAEAMGSFFEALAGLEGLTRWTPPLRHALVPAHEGAPVPALKQVWEAILPDRADLVKLDGGKLEVFTHDGSRMVLDAQGKQTAHEALAAGDYAARLAAAPVPEPTPDQHKTCAVRDRLLKLVVQDGERTAAGYWGGLVRVLDAAGKEVAAHRFTDDLTGLVWMDGKLVVGLSDRRIVALQAP